MKKYVIKRSDVLGGTLAKDTVIYIDCDFYDIGGSRVSSDDLGKFGISNFSVGRVECIECRKMLFSISERQMASDLIYTTPKEYRIDKVTPKIETPSKFHIVDYIELNDILAFLGYGIDLTQRDLNEIYKRFIVNGKPSKEEPGYSLIKRKRSLNKN